MTLDSISVARLASVHPKLMERITTLSSMLSLEGIDFRVTQGLRTWDEQAALYAQGRTAPGKIVTNAMPGYSWHNYGLAVDVVPMDVITGPDWNESHPAWQRMIKAGESLGLVSGSEWRTFPDYPHFQLTGALPVSPDDNVRQLYASGGTQAVWDATGLNNT